MESELKEALAMIPVGWGVVEYLVSGLSLLMKPLEDVPKPVKWALGGVIMIGLAFIRGLDVTGDPNTIIGTVLTGLSMAGGAKVVVLAYKIGKARVKS